MTLNRRFLKAWPALIVGLSVLLVAQFLFRSDQLPLTAHEARLVGEWSVNPADATEMTRTFKSNRTFATSNKQFVGVWRIQDGRLTVTYWQPYELPHEYSLSGVTHSVRRTRRHTISQNITFSVDGQQFILPVPVSKDSPTGQWIFHRISSMSAN